MTRKTFTQKNFLLAVIIAITTGFGLHLFIQSHAASPVILLEAEQGVAHDPASIISDVSASDGKSVSFRTAAGATPHTTVKLMPLGDSITNGLGYSTAYGGYGGYRVLLWQELVQQDHDNIDFVGSAQNGPSDLGDHDVEGHDGWTIDGGGTTALMPMLDGWLATYKPDIILLHAGTNDIRFGATGAQTATRLDAMLGKIYTDLPNVKVVLAQPIRNRIYDQTIITAQTDYNQAIPAVADKYRAEGRSIQVINMLDLLSYYDGDYSDEIHPSAHGYDKMAAAWYAVVSALYKSM